jgi:hypothetical protein
MELVVVGLTGLEASQETDFSGITSPLVREGDFVAEGDVRLGREKAT